MRNQGLGFRAIVLWNLVANDKNGLLTLDSRLVVYMEPLGKGSFKGSFWARVLGLGIFLIGV